MRCLVAVAFLVAVLALLSGCMVAHHQHTSEVNQEASAMARPHDQSQVTSAMETAEQKPSADVEQPRHNDGDMPMMMHGSGSWHWLMGGAMMVMMALVIL